MPMRYAIMATLAIVAVAPAEAQTIVTPAGVSVRAATAPAPSAIVEGQTAQAAPAGGYRSLLHVPQGYLASGDEQWPLIIFLHGSGERGDDIDKVKVHGPPHIAGDDPAFPFIVLSPQLPEGEEWNPAMLDATLDAALARLRADRRRIYLTGLSLGGMGTWDWAAARSDRFAAIAPVAARADTHMACRLTTMPTWVFHGDSDSVVPVDGDIAMAQAITACGGHPRLTIYPATDHDSWSATYANPALYLWFLHQRRSE